MTVSHHVHDNVNTAICSLGTPKIIFLNIEKQQSGVASNGPQMTKYKFFTIIVKNPRSAVTLKTAYRPDLR